jgi:hypothetical protein
VAQLVEALRHKTGGYGFYSRKSFYLYSVILTSIQPVTGMSTKDFPWEVKCGRRVELTTQPS